MPRRGDDQRGPIIKTLAVAFNAQKKAAAMLKDWQKKLGTTRLEANNHCMRALLPTVAVLIRLANVLSGAEDGQSGPLSSSERHVFIVDSSERKHVAEKMEKILKGKGDFRPLTKVAYTEWLQQCSDWRASERPALIIVHWHTFRADCGGSDPKAEEKLLHGLEEYLSGVPEARLILYSRAFADREGEAKEKDIMPAIRRVQQTAGDASKQSYSALAARITVLGWREQQTVEEDEQKRLTNLVRKEVAMVASARNGVTATPFPSVKPAELTTPVATAAESPSATAANSISGIAGQKNEVDKQGRVGVDSGNSPMTPQIWIGVIFAGAVVLFLMLAYFGPAMDAGRHAIIRFLCALCAGCAGGFITGSALFEYAQNLPNGGKIAFTAVAGCGLFGLVLLTFPKHQPPTGEEALEVSFPKGTSFQGAAKIIAQKNASVAIFEGFEEAEKKTSVTGTLSGQGKNRFVQVLRRLGDLAETPIRPYTVTFEDNAYLLRIS